MTRLLTTRDERRSVVGMVAAVVVLHMLGWGGLALTLRQGVPTGATFGVGLALTAYTLGMRHAFDADHIAAIDNTTRKLVGEGRRPLTVGFWFSLGHSTVVFLACVLLAFGVRAISDSLQGAGPRETLGLIGTLVSGGFLVVLGLMNLASFVQIARIGRRMKTDALDEEALEAELKKRGFFSRFLNGFTDKIARPTQMYPIGFLFGLGFDTATEVGLLAIAGGAGASGLPWYAILVLPVLFAAGMSLLDSADGMFMNVAYDWAFAKPERRIFYNLTVTALSVVVALVIGVIELAGVLADKLGDVAGPLATLGSLDMGDVGFAIFGAFVAVWVVAAIAWRVQERTA